MQLIISFSNTDHNWTNSHVNSVTLFYYLNLRDPSINQNILFLTILKRKYLDLLTQIPGSSHLPYFQQTNQCWYVILETTQKYSN